MDSLFAINTIAATINPQQIIYAALHQCYSPDRVFDYQSKWPDEKTCGDIVIKRLLAGDRGHWSPLEVASITFSCGYFPHSLVQQITRHRHLSFSIQSFRYTGQQVFEVVSGIRNVGQVFYLRPTGTYIDREGKKYDYTPELRNSDLNYCLESAAWYKFKINQGMGEEHARSLLPFDYRQHFVLSCNARSLCHLLDLRWKKDAQIECQWFCQLLFQRFEEWMPEIAAYYKSNRAHKGKLAP